MKHWRLLEKNRRQDSSIKSMQMIEQLLTSIDDTLRSVTHSSSRGYGKSISTTNGSN